MRKLLTLLFVAASLLGLTGCWGGHVWHQKLTVTVKTPTGEVSGSSVSEVRYLFKEEWSGIVLGDRVAHRGSLKGEATVVEVAPGKYLFALLDEKSKDLAFETFFPADPNARYVWSPPTIEKVRILQTRKGSEAVLKRNYPLLVTFRDINDPKSVREVKPDKLSDAFGAGYALKSITLEITDEDVSEGRIAAQPFWKQLLQQGTLSGLQIADKNLPDPINYMTFKAFKLGE
jgi:hypothetical protein